MSETYDRVKNGASNAAARVKADAKELKEDVKDAVNELVDEIPPETTTPTDELPEPTAEEVKATLSKEDLLQEVQRDLDAEDEDAKNGDDAGKDPSKKKPFYAKDSDGTEDGTEAPRAVGVGSPHPSEPRLEREAEDAKTASGAYGSQSEPLDADDEIIVIPMATGEPIKTSYGSSIALKLALHIVNIQYAADKDSVADHLSRFIETDPEVVKQLQTQIDSLDLENHDLKVANEELRKSRNDFKEAHETLADENSALKVVRRRLEDENDDLKVNLASTEGENNELKHRLAIVEAQYSKLKERAGELERENDLMVEVEAQYAALKEKATKTEVEPTSGEESAAEADLASSAELSASARCETEAPRAVGVGSPHPSEPRLEREAEDAETASGQLSTQETSDSSRLPHPAVCYIDDDGMMYDREAWKLHGKPAWDHEVHWRRDDIGEFSEEEVPADIAKRFRRGEIFDTKKDDDYYDLVSEVLRRWDAM